MKHFEQLSIIEEQIIRLDTVESMLRMMNDPSVERSDIHNVLWHLTEMLEEINGKLSKEFYVLWGQIRDDSDIVNDDFDDAYYGNDGEVERFEGGVTAEYNTDDNMNSSKYNFKPVEDAVKTWIEP